MKRWLLFGMVCLFTVPALAQTPAPVELPADLEPITAANVNRLESLGRYGRGTFGAPHWTPNGKTLVVEGSIGTWLYDAHNLAIQPVLIEDSYFQAISPEGQLLTQGPDLVLNVWSLDDLKTQLQASREQPFMIQHISIPQDNHGPIRAASVTDENRLYVWDVETWDVGGPLTSEYIVPDDISRTARIRVTFSPDGGQMAAAWSDESCTHGNLGGMSIFEPYSERTKREIVNYQHHNDLAFSPDGRLLAVATDYRRAATSQDGKEIPMQPGAVRVYDTDTGDLVVALAKGTQYFEKVTFSQDGRWLAAYNHAPFLAAGSASLVYVWDTATFSQIATLAGSDLQYAFSPDSEYLLTINRENRGNFELWKFFGNTPGLSLTTTPDPASFTTTDLSEVLFAFSLDSSTIGATNRQGQVFTWNISSNTQVTASVAVASERKIASDGQELRFQNDERGSFTIDSYGIKHYSDDARVSQNIQAQLLEGEEPVGYDPGGLLVATKLEGQIRIRDRANGELLHTLPSTARAVAFSPDGSFLINQFEADGIQLIKTDTGQPLMTLPASFYETAEASLVGAAFSSDGSLLVYAIEESGQCSDIMTTIRVWDMKAETERLAFVVAVGSIGQNLSDIKLSADNSLLLAQFAGVAQIFDVTTGQELFVSPGDDGAFSNDGRVFYLRLRDGRAGLWGVL